ncbi:BTAD domain-containing putative transcriptional regulator [Micromonospora sp. B11E3]|uniref:AfsR/SARP family transcriptional regulator n=1 Tax=Micromonospora sp. B11E3 TaxID=3153562 RepID=UPI00325C4DF6
MPELNLLGPVELRAAGMQFDAGPRKQRTVLAALLVDAGRPVPVAELIDRVWDQAPRQVRGALHTYVTRLRRLLAQAAQADGTSADLSYRAGAYTLSVDLDRIDLHRFLRLVEQGRAPGLADTERARLLRAALRLWRGTPLAGLSGSWVEQVGETLAQQRLAAVLALAPAELRLGRANAVVDELRGLLKEHPLSEPLAAQLMRALHQAGRGAEALDCFARVRRRLVEELGTEPGSELRRVHQALLRGDPDAPPPGPADRQAAPAPARRGPLPPCTPAQLPPAGQGFTGRDALLARLDGLADAADRRSGPVVVAVLSGTAGVGKTALAVHWAHRARHRFPDGQLYVNLRGFDVTGSAMSPGEALRGFLDALQVPAHRIPASLDGQVGLYRSLLADKRVLVLLDNARDAEQVRPLLPSSPGCLVVVTSRNQLSGLVVVEGAHSLVLDLPTIAETRRLLANRLGSDRTATQRSAVDDIITRCARLPLALAVVAARAAAAPTFPLDALADELREAQGALDAFAGGDTTTDVRTVFSWSYQTLSPPAARLFRLLALHPGPDISTPAVASLAGVPRPRARQLLAELLSAHLLTEHAPRRFSIHDLLRAYAGELTQAHDSDAERCTVTRRLLDHYLHSAYAAVLLLDPHRTRPPLTGLQPGVTPVRPTDRRSAMAWLRTERPVLLAVLAYATRTQHEGHIWQLAQLLASWFERQGHWRDWTESQLAALGAARRLGDPGVQAEIHRSLGRARLRQGRVEEGHRHHRTALTLATASGDRCGQARVHAELAAAWHPGVPARYLHRHVRAALDLERELGDRVARADVLATVGWACAQLGEHERAVGHCHRALTLQEETGDRAGAALSRSTLGYAYHHLGRHRTAVDCLRAAAIEFGELGDPYREATSLTWLGDSHRAAGELDAAGLAWRRALPPLDRIDPSRAEQVRARLRGLESRELVAVGVGPAYPTGVGGGWTAAPAGTDQL